MNPNSRMVPMPPDGDGWNEWRKYVLITLGKVVTGQDKLEAGQARIETKIAVLKVRAGLWGAIAGLIPSTIALIYWLLTRQGGI